MAGDPYKKVFTGDKLDIKSASFNRMLDAATRENSRGVGPPTGGPVGSRRLEGLIRVKNSSGGAIPDRGILGIDSVLVTPDDNLQTFKLSPTVNGVTPTVDAHFTNFVIAHGPIPKDAIGWGFVFGVCAVKVDIVSVDDSFADVDDGNSENLKSGEEGAAEILWNAGDTGVQWALVRLKGAGEPGGGGGLDAKITSKTAINGGIRWKYGIKFGQWNMNEDAANGGTWVNATPDTEFFAFNSAEDMNTFTSGTGNIGTGNSAVDQSDGTIGTSDCKLLPLPVGGYVVVKVRGTDTSGETPTKYYTIINFANSAES